MDHSIELIIVAFILFLFSYVLIKEAIIIANDDRDYRDKTPRCILGISLGVMSISFFVIALSSLKLALAHLLMQKLGSVT